jgi:hypothetical protein
MRRARIKPVHVARCVVYSFDLLFWAGLLGLAGAVVAAVVDLDGNDDLVLWVALNFMPVIAALLVLLVPYRLWAAYRFYLRFERPLLTVLASQVIALLVIVNVFMIIATWGVAA